MQPGGLRSLIAMFPARKARSCFIQLRIAPPEAGACRRAPAIRNTHQAAQMAARPIATTVGTILKPHGFCATKTIASLFWHLPMLLADTVLFAQAFGVAQKPANLSRHIGLLKNRANPLAVRRKPDPKIRCNLTPSQTARLRNAKRIPCERAAVSLCRIRSYGSRASLSKDWNETCAGLNLDLIVHPTKPISLAN